MTSSAINPSPGNPTSSWKPPSSWNPIILARKSRKTARSGGRGGGIRTPTRGFGDRWSAVKPTPLLASESINRLRVFGCQGLLKDHCTLQDHGFASAGELESTTVCSGLHPAWGSTGLEEAWEYG